MAITQVEVATPAGLFVFQDTVMGNAADGIKASSARLYSVSVDNSANGGAASYVKLYNAASGSVVVGTTVPDEVIFVPGGAVVTQYFFTGAAQGKVFGVALSAACVTVGGTTGTVSPSSAVIVSASYV